MKTINFFKTALLTIALFVCGNIGAETITISKAAIPDLTAEASEHTFSINDIEFIGKLKYSGDNLFFTSGSDYFYNTTSLGTINSITIYYGTNGSSSAHQYFSSGDVAISGYQSGTAQLTSSTPGTSGIYSTFNGGFFNLSISNKNLQASSIVIDYTPTTTTPTEAYTVTFNAGTGTCETTSLTETAPGAGITLPTATSPCPENWTFVGWAKEEVTNITNTQPITYATELTYYPTANETLYAVYTKTDESTSEATLTLNATNIGSMGGGTGYQDDDFTFSGITFGRKQAYINSQSIQIKKGTNYSVWNKTPLSGNIVSVTVTPKTNDCMLYVGSSAEPSTNSQIVSSTQTYEFEGTDGYRYFKIGATSSAYTQIQEVKIVYNESSATYSTNPDCSAITVAAPTFDVEAGRYYEPQVVTITAEEGATIYYTTNGEDPTIESSVYDTPIAISATTTLKAIATSNGNTSSIASATYTFPTEVNSIEAFYGLLDDTFAKITGNLTIVFVNGSSVYMQDASGSLLVYDNSLASTEGLTNGTVISNIVGTKTNHNGASQMQNILSHSIVGNGSVINPTTVTELTVADVHKYVKLEDAQFDNTYSFTESNSSINANLSTHGNIIVRNYFRNFTMDVNSTDKYDIIGFVSVYNNAPQIYPVSITITTPSFMISTDALDFDEVGRDQTKTLVFTLQGVNLTEDVTLNLSGTNAGYFEYTPQSISVNEDGSIEETTISVTYKPTELGNNHTATLTIASSGLNKTIALQGSCIKTVLPTPTATEATAITANGFTANWETVDNATSYLINVWTGEEPAFSVANSSFENGLENWDAEDGYSLSTDNAHTGSQSLAFTVKATKDLRQTIENLTPGEEITLSYWYYLNETSTGSGLRFWCYWVGNDDHSALQPDTYTNEKGAWTQTTITTTVPAGATALNLEIRVYNGANGYIDDITVTPANGNAITPITGSPFTVTEGTSLEVNNLTEGTTYYYNVVARAEGYTASEASNIISVITSNSTGTGICDQPEMEGISFNGQEIINSLNLDVVVYNAIGQMVVRSNENINMSSYPAGVYVIKAANGESMKIVK